MQIISSSALNAFDGPGFLATKPYPWANPDDLVTPEGYQALRENLPDISLFKSNFSHARKHGQKSHDRYSLKYHDGLEIPQVWQSFIDELRGEAYTRFVRQVFGVKDFQLSFFWFFTPTGCSVSPHCDHFNKFGVHLFYLNTDKDWDYSWGGETLILGSDKKFKRSSAPEFKDFDLVIGGETAGSHSLLFKRTSRSWHGVKDITCPEGYLRKVFMVSMQHTNAISKYYHALMD